MKTIVTKDDERKALEQIENIVAELGPDSYLATTFNGCFEQARENIDNDWACNWKDEADRLSEALETTAREKQEQKARIAELEAENEALKQESLSRADRRGIASLLEDYEARLDMDKQAEAEKVLANCQNPDSEAFKEASEKYGQIGYKAGKVEWAAGILMSN